MAPKPTLKKVVPLGTEHDARQGSPQKPVAPHEPVGTHTAYAEMQAEEMEVLRAIYMDDLREVAVKGAWKSADKSFTLRLKASSDESVFVLLSVTLTASYPKSLPLLNVIEAQAPPDVVSQVQALLESKPKEMVGEVMIHEIASAILEILEDAVLHRDDRHQRSALLPSLEEERARKEAEAARVAQDQEAERRQAQEAAQVEEDKELEELVKRELERRRDAKGRRNKHATLLREGSFNKNPDSHHRAVDFQRPTRLQFEGSGDEIEFSAVDRIVNIRRGPLTGVSTVQPTPVSDAASIKTALVLKHVNLKPASSNRAKLLLYEIENELEKIKGIRHESAINILDYLVDTTEDLYVNILVDYANKGSLQEMLEMVASIPTENVRTWTIQMLEALDFLHRNGVIHGRIHPNNLLLSRSLATGATAVKLSDAGFQQQLYDLATLTSGKNLDSWSATWHPPEISRDKKKSRKTDVWEAGAVFVQMLFGLDATRKYVSPESMMGALDLSEPLVECLGRFFDPDPRMRSTAFDLVPSEFLRSNVPVMDDRLDPQTSSSNTFLQALDQSDRPRRGSNLGFGTTASRYANEWVEQGRLGKGGYGEVVKARNKLDARIYAIKKVVSKSASELSSLLSEVMLLSRLNHPYVVRYYTAWPEEDSLLDAMTSDEDTTTATTTLDDEPSFSMRPTLDFGPSSRGLDFVSSSGFKIQFGNNSDESDDDSEAVASDDNISKGMQQDSSVHGETRMLNLRRTTSSGRGVRPVKTTLFIQMEFCERHTLRDLILRELYYSPEEGWKLFRQILEGLVHIHGHGIIHRDLKPDNIFMDVANNPRIGDFGLATSGQYQLTDKTAGSSQAAGDMTRSVGTTLYVAPELRSDATGSYDAKVDMYSLGIIFFEMCYPLRTTMERDRVLRQIRAKDHRLPEDFQKSDKAQQGEIILSLISHRPSERPSSVELLRSGRVPLQIEDDTIKEALRGLSDPSSPYYQKMMSALFAQPNDSHVKDFAWEIKSSGIGQKSNSNPTAARELVRGEVKDTLLSIFRRHGAVEVRRSGIFPMSLHYTNSNAVRLLDASGLLLQLPYDLTLPYARGLAREPFILGKTFALGNVFRDAYTGGAPQINGEADFDIVGRTKQDLALKEAEVIKVVDEIVDEIPSLNTGQMCFHLNHADVLEAILDFARVPKPVRPAVTEIISKLNIHDNTWQRIRAELRAPTLGVSATSLDQLALFDFRDTTERAISRVSSIFEGKEPPRILVEAFDHLRELSGYLKALDIRCKVYLCPLSSFNQKFYVGGTLFQCLFDSKKKSVLAAGGRYDNLIREFRPRTAGSNAAAPLAAGVNIGWDRLVASMERYYGNSDKQSRRKSHARAAEEASEHRPKRSDVVVASFDANVLRSTGLKVLAELWKNDITAELAIDARSVEELHNHYGSDDGSHSWLVIVKQDASGSNKPDLKVRSFEDGDEAEVQMANLVAHIRTELRERSQRDRTRLLRHQSGQADPPSASGGQGRLSNSVHVLVSHHRSKKSNKWGLVEAAQARAKELLGTYSTAPILAVETRDDIVDKIRDTRLSDTDSWRRVIQNAPLGERQYLGQIFDMLVDWSRTWKASKASEGSTENLEESKSGVAFVHNFRSGACILYDLTS